MGETADSARSTFLEFGGDLYRVLPPQGDDRPWKVYGASDEALVTTFGGCGGLPLAVRQAMLLETKLDLLYLVLAGVPANDARVTQGDARYPANRLGRCEVKEAVHALCSQCLNLASVALGRGGVPSEGDLDAGRLDDLLSQARANRDPRRTGDGVLAKGTVKQSLTYTRRLRYRGSDNPVPQGVWDHTDGDHLAAFGAICQGLVEPGSRQAYRSDVLARCGRLLEGRDACTPGVREALRRAGGDQSFDSLVGLLRAVGDEGAVGYRSYSSPVGLGTDGCPSLAFALRMEDGRVVETLPVVAAAGEGGWRLELSGAVHVAPAGGTAEASPCGAAPQGRPEAAPAEEAPGTVATFVPYGHSALRLVHLGLEDRPRERAAVGEALSQGRVAALWGFGGIGKTTTARLCAAEGKPGGKGRWRRAYLVEYHRSISRTMADLPWVPEQNPSALPAACGFDEACERLGRLTAGGDTLVILDNFFDDDVPSFSELWQANEGDGDLMTRFRRACGNLVVTTRYNLALEEGDFVPVDVGRFGPDELRGLFCPLDSRTGQPSFSYDEGEFDRFADLVEGNTLVVVLVGRLLARGGGLTLGEVTDVIARGDIAGGNLNARAVADPVRGTRDRFVGHVMAVFDVAACDEAEVNALSCLALMGQSDRIDEGCFARALEDAWREAPPAGEASPSALDVIDGLVDGSWVERDRRDEAGHMQLGLHALVRAAVRAAAFGGDRGREVRRWYARSVLGQVTGDASRATLADLLAARGASTALGDLVGREDVRLVADLSEMLGRDELAASLWGRLAGLDSSRDGVVEALVHVAKVERRRGDALRCRELAGEALGWLGLTADDLRRMAGQAGEGPSQGEPVDARRLLLASRAVLQHACATHDLFEDRYGEGYQAFLAEAVAGKRLALDLQRLAGADEAEVAATLCTLAYSEDLSQDAGPGGVPDHEAGRAHATEAVAMMRACASRAGAGRDVREALAASLNYLGHLLDGSSAANPTEEELAEALRLKREALRMREELLPADHIDVARSHNNVSLTLWRMGRRREAWEENQAALAILDRRARAGELLPTARRIHAQHDLMAADPEAPFDGK